MNRKEAMRQTHMYDTLRSLGFTQDEAEALRRISMTLQRWHELECGTGDGQVSVSVERDGDEPDSKPYKRIQYPTANGYHDKRYPIADRETGARKRLAKIIADRNARRDTTTIETRTFKGGFSYDRTTSAHGMPDVSAYIQTDPRGAALYIIRPGDIPAGMAVESCYSRGICVY